VADPCGVGEDGEYAVENRRRIPFAQRCPETKVIVSGNIHYEFQTDRSSWLKTGFDCKRQKECGINTADCPIYKSAEEVLIA
jgi:hypothetical protein